MIEVLTEDLAYGFVEMRLHRIEARPYTCNPESRNLLLKLGSNTKECARASLLQGHFLDQLYFGSLSQKGKDERLNLSAGQKSVRPHSYIFMYQYYWIVRLFKMQIVKCRGEKSK